MRLSPAKCLAAVLILAFGLRLAAGWGWQAWLGARCREPVGFGDSEGYFALARAIAHGEPYQYGPEGFRVFRTPGYPILLSPLSLMAGDWTPVMWARALSAILDTTAVAGVGWLAWWLFSPWAGVLAAAMAAFYPGSIAVGVLILSEAPFCPLMLLHLGLWMAAWNTGREKGTSLISAASSGAPVPAAKRISVMSPFRGAGLAFAAGLAAGAATLMRPSWLLFIPFALAMELVFGGAEREKGTGPICAKHPSGRSGKWGLSPFPSRHFGHGLVMLAGLALAMTPWWVRNARVTGRFVPTTLQVGSSLYDGLSLQATGASDWAPVERKARRLMTAIVPADPGALRPGDWEYRLDAQLRQEALSWAYDNPLRVAELAAVKFVRMWNIWPNEPGMSAWPIRWGLAVTYVPILALGVWGAARTLRRGWPYVLCWLPAVYFTLLHVVFVSSIRYRQPAMLGLMVLAAGVATRWKTRDEG